MNYQDFISKKKSLIIAPAGYGKTYALAKCLKFTKDSEIQLIITHTHAGIAAIKEKIRQFNIPSSKYHIETITGFAQRYSLAFCCSKNIPFIGDPSYFNFIINTATQLLGKEAIKRIVRSSYQGLFVDEYQDCTITQHKMIMALAEILPTHLMGDPMQGIFDFNESLVNFKDDLENFEEVEPLDTPWRWYTNNNNKDLGDELKKIRTILDSRNKIVKLKEYSSVIPHIIIRESEIFDYKSGYREHLNKLINSRAETEMESMLLIVPEYFENSILKGDIESRSMLKAQIDYSNKLTLLEAIDNKDFYSIAKRIDDIIIKINHKRKKISALKDEIFCRLFNKGNLDEWIADNRLKIKREPNIELRNKLEFHINNFINTPSITALLNIIIFLKNEIRFKSRRKDLLNSIIKAINIAISENKSVYEGMVSYKNVIRRVGRKINRKCIGTTLLTKGLEFDTVVLLNAHRFTNYKQFYVAITRACKRLVIFTEKEILSFNN